MVVAVNLIADLKSRSNEVDTRDYQNPRLSERKHSYFTFVKVSESYCLLI